jgi:hypothetical protein
MSADLSLYRLHVVQRLSPALHAFKPGAARARWRMTPGQGRSAIRKAHAHAAFAGVTMRFRLRRCK